MSYLCWAVKTFAVNSSTNIEFVNKTSEHRSWSRGRSTSSEKAKYINSTMSEPQPEPVQFKPKKKKNLRQRKASSDEEEEDSGNREEILWVIWWRNKIRNWSQSLQLMAFIHPHPSSAKLEETKLAQKLRVKPNGVNVIGLAIGAKVTPEDLLTKVCLHQHRCQCPT